MKEAQPYKCTLDRRMATYPGCLGFIVDSVGRVLGKMVFNTNSIRIKGYHTFTFYLVREWHDSDLEIVFMEARYPLVAIRVEKKEYPPGVGYYDLTVPIANWRETKQDLRSCGIKTFNNRVTRRKNGPEPAGPTQPKDSG